MNRRVGIVMAWTLGICWHFWCLDNAVYYCQRAEAQGPCGPLN